MLYLIVYVLPSRILEYVLKSLISQSNNEEPRDKKLPFFNLLYLSFFIHSLLYQLYLETLTLETLLRINYMKTQGAAT